MTHSEVMACTNTCSWGSRICTGGSGGEQRRGHTDTPLPHTEDHFLLGRRWRVEGHAVQGVWARTWSTECVAGKAMRLRGT